MEAFKILKPVLWFPEGSAQPRAKLNSILTNEAIATLVENECLEFIDESEETFIYILFGGLACIAYHEGLLPTKIKSGKFSDCDYALQKLPQTMSPLKAFEMLSGWDDYAEITKEEYEHLKSTI